MYNKFKMKKKINTGSKYLLSMTEEQSESSGYYICHYLCNKGKNHLKILEGGGYKGYLHTDFSVLIIRRGISM